MVRVLLIEDNQDDIDLMLHSFKRHHFTNKIAVVMDGEEALRSLEQSKKEEDIPGLILLDLKLPKVDGIELLERIKDDPMLRSIPVVVLTSSEEEKDVEDCYRLGVNSYIVKPVDFEKFVSTIHTLGFYWLLLNKPPRLGSKPA
jgi:two-component system response regulator